MFLKKILFGTKLFTACVYYYLWATCYEFCFLLALSYASVLFLIRVLSKFYLCLALHKVAVLLFSCWFVSSLRFVTEQIIFVLWKQKDSMYSGTKCEWKCTLFCTSLWTQKRPPLLWLLYKTGQSLHLEDLFLAGRMLVNFCWWSMQLGLWVNEMGTAVYWAMSNSIIWLNFMLQK
jgi:hypothetical protein